MDTHGAPNLHKRMHKIISHEVNLMRSFFKYSQCVYLYSTHTYTYIYNVILSGRVLLRHHHRHMISVVYF